VGKIPTTYGWFSGIIYLHKEGGAWELVLLNPYIHILFCSVDTLFQETRLAEKYVFDP